MTTLFKLTDKDGVSGAKYGMPLTWAPGTTHEISAKKYRGVLCDRGIIHAYESPLVAVFMNTIHADYSPARLWRCETDAEIVRDGQLKCGVRKLTCVEELRLPEITTAARTRAAILCAWEVCKDQVWRAWATSWLSGEDRSAESAMMAAWAAEEAAARAAEIMATERAAEAAAMAAEDTAEWTAARAVARAAWAVAKPELNLHAIIERAIREEE